MTNPLHDFHADERGVKRLSSRQIFQFLVRYGRAQQSGFLGGLGLLLSSTLLYIGSAHFLGVLIGTDLVQGESQRCWLDCFAVLLFELSAMLTSYAGRRVLALMSSRALLAIRFDLFAHTQELPMSYYDRQPQGRIITRMTHDVEGMDDFFSSSMGMICFSILSTVVTAISMLVICPWLGALALLSLLPAIALTLITRERALSINRLISRWNSALNARLSEFIQGMYVIRLFGLENWSTARYEDSIRHHRAEQLTVNFLNCWLRPLVAFLCSVPLLVVFIIGGYSVESGGLALAVLLTFIRLCDRMARPIDTLSREIHVIQQAFSSAERVAVFLGEQTESQAFVAGFEKPFDSIRGEIEFRDVSLSYAEGRVALNELSFKIPAGTRVGLLGATGSGKSSTVSLLTRLYEYQQGQILLDGVSLRDYSRSWLRSKVGFVSQDVVIFEGSILENITLGREVPRERVSTAAKETGLEAVLQRRGLHLDSAVLDKGADLSAGERQLLALTRVLLGDPSILILDEATANIDKFHEEIIHQAVTVVMRQRTTLIIAHRLQTIEQCNLLLVFDQGKVVEQGTHAELFVANGYYRRLLESDQRLGR